MVLIMASCVAVTQPAMRPCHARCMHLGSGNFLFGSGFTFYCIRRVPRPHAPARPSLPALLLLRIDGDARPNRGAGAGAAWSASMCGADRELCAMCSYPWRPA